MLNRSVVLVLEEEEEVGLMREEERGNYRIN